VVRRSGLSEKEWFEKMWPAAETVARDYPRLHKRYVAQPAGDIPKSRNESFEHELGLILDGLDHALRKRD
jgi:hypothetical protein